MSGNKLLLGQMIKTMREARGLSQAELAKAVRKKPSAISNYERGYREPDLDTIEALADVFNVPMSSLLEYASTPTSNSSVDTFASPPSDADELLNLYSTLNDDGKAQVLSFVRAIAGNPSMQDGTFASAANAS